MAGVSISGKPSPIHKHQVAINRGQFGTDLPYPTLPFSCCSVSLDRGVWGIQVQGEESQGSSLRSVLVFFLKQEMF